MIKIYQILITIVFYNLVNGTCTIKEKCHLYKNSKFLWWGTDCGKFCHQVGKRVTCMWYQYHQGCFCKHGFFRDRNWDCVPIQGCDTEIGGSSVPKPKPVPIVITPSVCPPNEIWTNCGNLCSNLCESLNNRRACRYEKCTKGCFCQSGMLRNYNGACIRKDQCTKMMVSGSVKFQFSMSVSLSLWIKKYYTTGKQCNRKRCKPQVKNEPVISNDKCRQNEEFTTCGDKCMEQCRNLFMAENCPLSCQSGCFCRAKYYRNNRGDCIHQERCPGYSERKWLTTTTTHRPAQETTSTTTPSPSRPKATYGTTSTTTEKPVRNVSDAECPMYEMWSNCGGHCQELCENNNAVVTRSVRKATSKCSPNMNCLEGCFCIPGYYRDTTDSCVPKRMCPTPPPPTEPPIECQVNEHYTRCGSKCSESCSVFNETIELNCPPKCDEGCFCVQGFYRDRFGVCVPQDQCECEIPHQMCGDPKEEYLVCGKNCLQTCAQKSPECKDTCARGCFCREGHVYNENGVCVQPAQCGQDIRNGTKEGQTQIVKPGVTCPGSNEMWSDCGNPCEDHCEPASDGECSLICETGCFCKRGYLRNTAGQCVIVERCNERPTCVENEEYSDCGTNCAARCKDIGRNRQCPFTCEKGCFCRTGYFWDDDGKCIPRGKCVIDTNPECAAHEVYRNCSTHCGNTCEDLRNPVKCPKPERECDKGCFCEPDYYRDIDATCVTKLDCNLPPPVTEEPICDDNEMYKECGNRCYESCEDSIKCKKNCENGCFCIDDYLRTKKGKCVLSEKCKGPPQCAECKPNEYYTDCGTDCGRMCTDLQTDVVCDKDTPCHAGCICKWGFYRTPDGDCVTQNECQFFIDEDQTLIDYVSDIYPDNLRPRSLSEKVRPFGLAADYYRDNYDDYSGIVQPGHDKGSTYRTKGSHYSYDDYGYDDHGINAVIPEDSNYRHKYEPDYQYYDQANDF